jgi:hypothetical protein
MSESLFLKVARNTWNTKKNKMERTEQRIYPESSFDLKSEHQGHKTRYCLTGGIVHRGGANSGHYLSVLLISGEWYEIDDERVRIIPEKEATRLLESHGVLIMYQKKRELSKGEAKPKKVVDKVTVQDKKESRRKHTETGSQASRPNRGGRRHRFFQPFGTKRSNKPRWEQYGKTHLTEQKRYYDPDKKCFYIPKL